MMSIWIELAFFLANIFLVSSIGVCLEVFPNFFRQSVLKGSLGVFLDQPNIFFCQCLFNGFDQHLSELVLMYLFLSLPVVRNLLMSIWTELACLLASIFLVSSISVCLEVSPNVFCQSV